jgi:pyruvate dehydrogenase E2 component (dihydrolipoamide acetyltransferase)
MSDLTMPQLGETVSEGTVSRWLVSAGQAVTKGQPLLEISTDKVDTEIESPGDGTVVEIRVPEGETVDVGTVLAVLSTDSSSDSPVRAAPAPVARAVVAALTAPAPAVRPAGTRQRLSPLVRRLASEHAVDLTSIVGTGREGRIRRDDVLAAVSAVPPVDDERSTYIPFGRIRRLVAQRTQESKRTSAHAFSLVEVDYAGVDAVRAEAGPAWREREGYTLTALPFVARAVVLSLAEYPDLNASVEGDGLRRHIGVGLGIAVDLGEGGLVAPVVHDAHDLSLPGLARHIRAVATSARDGSLRPDALAGGTFSISNNGSVGSVLTVPIIQQPQVAILSTDAVRRRPVVLSTPDGEVIAIRPIGNLALSWDHRAVDGAYAARFLVAVRDRLESRDWRAELGAG